MTHHNEQNDREQIANTVAELVATTNGVQTADTLPSKNGPAEADTINARFLEAADDEHEPELGKRFPNCDTAPPSNEAQARAEPPADDDPERVIYNRLTCAALDAAQYVLEFLISLVLVAGQPCIIAGGKKTLKTTIVVAMALALATGRDFLGKFRVRRAARVALMSGESGLAVLQETFRRIALSMDLNLSDIDTLIVSPDLPKFGSLRHMEALREFLSDDEIEVLFIDPAFLAMPGADAGNLFIQGAMLRAMTELCQELGVTLVIIHHTCMHGSFEPPELEDISWAGFQEWCRQWVLLGRREKHEPGTGSHKLWMSIGGSAGHSSLHALDIEEGQYREGQLRSWSVDIMPAAEARKRVDDQKDSDKEAKKADSIERDKKAILTATLKCPDKRGTMTDIRSRSGRNSKAFSTAFAELLSDGDLLEDGELLKGNNRAYPAYKVREE